LKSLLTWITARIGRWLRAWTKPANPSLVVGMLTDLPRNRSQLIRENLLLRQQLIVLKRQVKHPKFTWRDRAMLILLACSLPRWRDALLIVQPDTLLRWHRELFRLVWRHKSKHHSPVGRPPLSSDTVALIQQMATANRLWGAKRIHGELLKLGIRVSKRTIKKYMLRARRDLPPRSSGSSWSTFIANHAPHLWACDFLQTYDLFFRTIFVFFIIELSSRRVVHCNLTRSPSDIWVAQQLREATAFGQGPRFLICDNDSKYGAAFERVAAASRIELLRAPYRAPKANATCERFLGSVRRECLDHILILNERQLRKIIAEYVGYFNHARPH
jgi:transposase InsO family protein